MKRQFFRRNEDENQGKLKNSESGVPGLCRANAHQA